MFVLSIIHYHSHLQAPISMKKMKPLGEDRALLAEKSNPNHPPQSNDFGKSSSRKSDCLGAVRNALSEDCAENEWASIEAALARQKTAMENEETLDEDLENALAIPSVPGSAAGSIASFDAVDRGELRATKGSQTAFSRRRKDNLLRYPAQPYVHEAEQDPAVPDDVDMVDAGGYSDRAEVGRAEAQEIVDISSDEESSHGEPSSAETEAEVPAGVHGITARHQKHEVIEISSDEESSDGESSSDEVDRHVTPAAHTAVSKQAPRVEHVKTLPKTDATPEAQTQAQTQRDQVPAAGRAEQPVPNAAAITGSVDGSLNMVPRPGSGTGLLSSIKYLEACPLIVDLGEGLQLMHCPVGDCKHNSNDDLEYLPDLGSLLKHIEKDHADAWGRFKGDMQGTIASCTRRVVSQQYAKGVQEGRLRLRLTCDDVQIDGATVSVGKERLPVVYQQGSIAGTQYDVVCLSNCPVIAFHNGEWRMLRCPTCGRNASTGAEHWRDFSALIQHIQEKHRSKWENEWSNNIAGCLEACVKMPVPQERAVKIASGREMVLFYLGAPAAGRRRRRARTQNSTPMEGVDFMDRPRVQRRRM